MKYAKVKDNPELIRDMDSKAILNTNIDSLTAYKRRREKTKEIDQTIDDINTMKQDINEFIGDINTIKQDINDLKTLMQRILDKIG